MSTAHHSDNTIDGTPIPTLDDIASQHMTLSPWVARTPTFERHDFPTLEGTPVNFKFELLQVGGTHILLTLSHTESAAMAVAAVVKAA